jgi:UDP-2-acetamido-2-deoxy-ribo-hexuluronate aminotransferase
VHYPRPLYRQPAYAHWHRDGAELAHSVAAAEQVLSLPMSADLTHADQDRVVAALAGVLAAT